MKNTDYGERPNRSPKKNCFDETSVYRTMCCQGTWTVLTKTSLYLKWKLCWSVSSGTNCAYAISVFKRRDYWPCQTFHAGIHQRGVVFQNGCGGQEQFVWYGRGAIARSYAMHRISCTRMNGVTSTVLSVHHPVIGVELSIFMGGAITVIMLVVLLAGSHRACPEQRVSHDNGSIATASIALLLE